MSTQVQTRRGTTAEHSTFTGAVGELTVDTTKDTVVVHDGATAGGRALLREDQSNLPTSAPTTGLYNNSGALALSTNGTQRLLIDASGNVNIDSNTLYVDATNNRVGIGTTSPAYALDCSSSGETAIRVDSAASYNAALRFSQAGTNKAFINYQNGGGLTFGPAGSEAARLDASGRLLVGISSARSNFFNTSTISPGLQLEGTNFSTSSVSIVANSSGSQYPLLMLSRSKGSSVGSNTIVASDDVLGHISFQGNDGAEFVPGAVIKAEVDGTPGANDMPGRLVFSTTADGASSPTERMRIDSSGFVSLGGDTNTGFSNPSADNLAITTGGSERARITSDGYVRLASGTGGIQFNGDTAAANALDDYEEGTWTPSLSGGSGTPNNACKEGWYIKTGRKVYCWFYIASACGGGGSTFKEVSLPFTAVGGRAKHQTAYLVKADTDFTVTNAVTRAIGGVYSGTSSLSFNPAVTITAIFYCSFTYETA